MSFEDLTFSYSISIGYANGKVKDTIRVSEYFEEDEWNRISDKEKDKWLDEYLETEVSNCLDANIWIDS